MANRQKERDLSYMSKLKQTYEVVTSIAIVSNMITKKIITEFNTRNLWGKK